MIRFVAETGSTNADLLNALKNGERTGEGEWLVADRQTAGRGRQGRDWFDGAGNFMGSTLVRTSFGEPPPASLALMTGLAVYEAILPYLATPSSLRLKWPNDVALGRAKLAGILLERAGDTVVIGIGINLKVAPRLPDRPTVALSDVGPAPDRDTFATVLANHFATELRRWRDYGLGPLTRRWEAAAHPPGTPLTVAPPGEESLSGTFAGLTDEGALSLRLADGALRVIHAGDVFFAGPEA